MYQIIGDYLIRDWLMEDASTIAQYANNKKIWLNLRDAFPHPYGLEDAQTFLLRNLDTNPRTAFAIATPSEAIGSIGLMLGKDVHRHTAEMGYWLAEPFWGQGIMTAAVKSLTAYAIDEFKLHRICAVPYVTNHASARVLEKAGYLCEGRLRSSVVKDGKVLDQLIYGYTDDTRP